MIFREFLAFLFLCLSIPLAISRPAHGRDAQVKSDVKDVDLQTYEAELKSISMRIEEIKHRPADLKRFGDSLPSEWIVNTGETRISVSTDPLYSALKDLQTDQKKADELARQVVLRLEAMREAAIEMRSGGAGISIPTAQQRLEKVFERREFGGMKGPSKLQLLEQRIALWIARQIARLFQLLHVSAKTGNFLAWAVIALAFLAGGYWVFRTISQRAAEPELPSSTPASSSGPRMWLNDALAAAERGDYREAVRCGYWAAIARLEDLKILLRDRSRTPRESLRLLDSHPIEQVSLRELTHHFELIWYGYRTATRADWTGARAELEKIGCLRASIAATANS